MTLQSHKGRASAPPKTVSVSVRVPPAEGSIFALSPLIAPVRDVSTQVRSGAFHLPRSRRTFRKPSCRDVEDTYREQLKPLCEDTSDVPAKEPGPIKTKRCRVERQASALRKDRWQGLPQRTRVAQFKSARNAELTKALLAHRVSKAETSRERRKLGSHVDTWATTDREQLDASLSGGPTGGVQWESPEGTSTFDLPRLFAAWEGFFAEWFEGEFLHIVEQQIAQIKKNRPARGRTVRVNGERKWVRRRGRPRTPLRPTRYKPRQTKPIANFAADASATQSIE